MPVAWKKPLLCGTLYGWFPGTFSLAQRSASSLEINKIRKPNRKKSEGTIFSKHLMGAITQMERQKDSGQEKMG